MIKRIIGLLFAVFVIFVIVMAVLESRNRQVSEETMDVTVTDTQDSVRMATPSAGILPDSIEN